MTSSGRGSTQGDFNGGLLAAMDVVDADVTPRGLATLNAYRVANAVIGIPGGILAFVLTAGTAFITWRREGDDPEVLDSESVLMAGPPAGMTPPLATVVREGRASKDALQTILIELAGTGFIRFRNLDRVGHVKSDDDPNPETDPASTSSSRRAIRRIHADRPARRTGRASGGLGRGAKDH